MNQVMATGSLRRLAEWMFGRVILVRSLPAEAGGARIVVSARVGGLKYLFKASRQWDPELLCIVGVLVRPANSVWDVGANVGLFAVAAGHRAGPNGTVLAMEVHHDAFPLLFSTARRGGQGLTVLPTAISQANGFVRFAIAKRARAANAIEDFGSTQTVGIFEIGTLPSRTLDSLLDHFPAPTVLKVDVEGADLAVLGGASRVLSKVQPRIYCEVTGQTREEATDLLRNIGYETFDGQSFGTAHPRAVGPETTNLAAVPVCGSEFHHRGN